MESQSNVIIGENARVVANVAAFNITVAGSVEGNVKAIGRLEILSTGRVMGDVQAGSLLIEEGGVFHGQSLMDAAKQTPVGQKKKSPGPATQNNKERQNQQKDRAPEGVQQEPAVAAEER